jgi:hypothetical protein
VKQQCAIKSQHPDVQTTPKQLDQPNKAQIHLKFLFNLSLKGGGGGGGAHKKKMLKNKFGKIFGCLTKLNN